MADAGYWIVGTPDDCVEGIKRLDEQSGGYGGFMVQTIDWARREQMLHSYELFARYVMPRFQDSLSAPSASNRWAADRKETLVSGRARAIHQARDDYTAQTSAR